MALPMNTYMTPEQAAASADSAAALAGIEDPQERMRTMGGMQQFANQLPQMNRIKERDNGRVVGRASMMEGLGQMGSQLAGAYMNKQLMDKYGSMMDDNNAARINAARIFALRGQPGPSAAPGGATAMPVYTPNPTMTE